MIEGDVRDEISFHIEERVRELVDAGWDEPRARAHVLGRFGDVASVEEACRDYDAQRVDGETWRAMMEGWTRDVRLTLRGMRRSPGFTAVVVLTLGLGIGATTAVFSVVEGFLLRPLPFRDPGRLVMVWENDRATGTSRENASPLDYYDFVDRARGFDGFAMLALTTSVLTRQGRDPVRLNTARVTRNLTELLGIDMQLGRGFTAEEDRPDGPRTLLLTDGAWRTYFQADPDVVGRVVDVDGEPLPVVGVLPPDIDYPAGETDVWVPLQMAPAVATRENHWVSVVARMAPGTTVSAAQAEMTRLMAQLEVEYAAANTNRGAFVERLADVGRGDLRLTLWVLFGAVLTLLAIACVNVANLLLARGASRARELAVHVALGAGAAQLRRRFFVEGALMTLLATVGGVGLAMVGVRLLGSAAPARLMRLGAPGVNGTVLGFTLGVGALIGVGFALLPTLQARRTDLQRQLKDGRTSEGRTPRLAARRLLVAGQLALAVVLLTGATLLMSTLRNLQAVDPGFQTTNVLRVDYSLPESRYPRDFSNWPNWTEVNGFNRSLIARVSALPGVRAAAVVTNHPLDRGFTNSFQIEGRPRDAEQGEITTRLVTPGYFETVGLALLEGRLPSPSEGPSDPHLIVINRTAADRYFRDGGAIGSRVGFWGQYREIVGIVADEHMHGLAEPVPPALYVNLLQTPPVATKITLMVRTEVPPLDLAEGVRRTVWSLDRDLAVFNVATMDGTLADASARERFASLVLVVFAGVAVFLAVLGVHGVLAYLVAQRGHEVGVRMALGATRRQVIAVVVRQGASMAALGVAIGVVAALAVSGVLRGLLFGVSATAPWAYAAVAVGLGLTALVGTALPALGAASIDPVASLRGE
jgi:predicted permease